MEAYPRETVGKVATAALYTGTATMFHAVVFAEVARRTPERPMMGLVPGERGKLAQPAVILPPISAARRRPPRQRCAAGRSNKGEGHGWRGYMRASSGALA